MKTYEFGYNSRHFEQIRVIAKNITGIEIDTSKMDMIYTRLVRILRKSPFADFSEYVAALSQNNSDLNREFINAITTNLTSFFREKHHFELLKSTVLPELLAQKRADKTIKIWSAGCSSGEEPYSLAFTLEEYFLNKPAWHYKIFASDIDTNVLTKAREGVYSLDVLDNIPTQDLGKWFQKGIGANDGLCRVKPKYTAAIDFFQCNLMESLQFDTVFDIIFCRNVLIYFDTQSQTKILDQLMLHLTPNGFIFTGHSESFMYHYKKTKLISKTVYRKVL